MHLGIKLTLLSLSSLPPRLHSFVRHPTLRFSLLPCDPPFSTPFRRPFKISKPIQTPWIYYRIAEEMLDPTEEEEEMVARRRWIRHREEEVEREERKVE